MEGEERGRSGERKKGEEKLRQNILPTCYYYCKTIFTRYLYQSHQTLSHNSKAKARFPTIHSF